VLDVGCGRGLLTVGVARRLSNGSVTGVDVWMPTAVSGNRADSVLENARIEQVADRVSIQEGDARKLPFPDGAFDVVVSNFVVHELQLPGDREKMMAEIARVLKRGGKVALADFIFTDECVTNLRKFGVEAQRERNGWLSFWITAILNLGTIRTYLVIGTKNGVGMSADAAR
jgi:ubiquinone/menaquinone biosynthesis C-methylase UbiE